MSFSEDIMKAAREEQDLLHLGTYLALFLPSESSRYYQRGRTDQAQKLESKMNTIAFHDYSFVEFMKTILKIAVEFEKEYNEKDFQPGILISWKTWSALIFRRVGAPRIT